MNTLTLIFSILFLAVFATHIVSVSLMHVAQYKFSMYSKKVFFRAHVHLLITAAIVLVWFVFITKGGTI